MKTLKKLIYPIETEIFFQEYWTKKHLLIPNNGTDKFKSLFSWEKLNYLLNFHELTLSNIRLSKNEKVLEPKEYSKFLQHTQEGGTLIIDKVHKLIPEIAQLVSELRLETGWKFQVNMYCSGGGKQGFSCHYDTHEVFALQIEGSKQWHIYEDTYKYPLTEEKSKLYSPPEGEANLICTLKPGDIIYIPRGHWHYAIAHDEPSLHLTLGVHCKKGVDLLEWLKEELGKNEEWRKNLPILTDTNLAKNYIDNLIKDLHKYLGNSQISSNYLNNAINSEPPLMNFSFPYQLGFNIFPHGKDTKFSRPKFQPINISKLENDKGYNIRVANKEITLNGVSESFIKNLFNTYLFTGNDIINWLPDYD